MLAACLIAATVAVVLGCRWFGPHDLYEKDQPKTMAYTADVLLHGRYALPRDMIYQPATKPPMYNWIDAAVVGGSGVWSEWTLKFPSVLGVLVTGGIVYAMARRASRHAPEAAVVGLLAVGIWFTFGSDIRHGSVLRLSYLARPDMLLTTFCTAAWACFTIAAERPSNRSAFVPAMSAWLCVAGAALTKGPAAALPAVFGILYAMRSAARIPSDVSRQDETSPPLPSRFGRFAVQLACGRSWPLFGIGLLVVVVGGWLMAASVQDATHVKQVIWGAELAGRISQTPEGFRNPWYHSLMWFVTKAWPWGAVAVVGLILTAWLPRLRRSVGPSALYLIIVLIGLSLPAAKRMDYLLPAYAPAAVLVAVLIADVVRERVLGLGAAVAAAGAIVVVLIGRRAGGDWMAPVLVIASAGACLLIERRRRVPLAVLTVVPLVLATLMARAHLHKSLEATNRWSDNAVAFVEKVGRIVPADANLLVVVRGKHPLVTLLGRHQGSFLTPAALASADYVILPTQADLQPILTSRPLPIGFDVVEERTLSTLGLYRKVPLDRLIAAQKACAEWTPTENPYHAPGTVFRDDRP